MQQSIWLLLKQIQMLVCQPMIRDLLYRQMCLQKLQLKVSLFVSLLSLICLTLYYCCLCKGADETSFSVWARLAACCLTPCVICIFVLTSCAQLKHSLTVSTIQVAHALDIFSESNVRQDNLHNLIDGAAVNIKYNQCESLETLQELQMQCHSLSKGHSLNFVEPLAYPNISLYICSYNL